MQIVTEAGIYSAPGDIAPDRAEAMQRMVRNTSYVMENVCLSLEKRGDYGYRKPFLDMDIVCYVPDPVDLTGASRFILEKNDRFSTNLLFQYAKRNTERDKGVVVVPLRDLRNQLVHRVFMPPESDVIRIVPGRPHVISSRNLILGAVSGADISLLDRIVRELGENIMLCFRDRNMVTVMPESCATYAQCEQLMKRDVDEDHASHRDDMLFDRPYLYGVESGVFFMKEKKEERKDES